MHKIIPMASTPRNGRSALDEFLPERVFANDNGKGSSIDPADIELDAIQTFPEPVRHDAAAPPDTSSRVQLWPMIAAAFVAIGASILALLAFARFGYF